MTRVALKQGLHKATAVDAQGVRMLHRYQVPIGHVGHLCQMPKGDISEVLDMDPEVITVYTVEQTRMISESAQEKGKRQNLLARVVGPNDCFSIAKKVVSKKKSLSEKLPRFNPSKT